MDPIQIAISLGSLICCCLFWGVVLGGIVWFVMNRGGGDDAADFDSETDKLEAKSDVPKPTGDANDFDDEDELETVVAPSPAAEKKDPPKPAPRTSGATIIAFDDDEDF